MELSRNTTPMQGWNRAARGAAWQQHWAYGAACEALGSRVIRVDLSADNEVIGLAQMVHRRLFGCLHAAVCTRGPVWLGAPGPEARAEALARLRRELPLPWLRGLFVTPEAGADEIPILRKAGLARVMTPYSTAVINLMSPTETLRANMHQKWRNRLVVAERAGLTVRRADRRPDLYAWLLEREAKQQRARRYQALPVALIPAWQAASGGVLVLTAQHQGETVAAMLFLMHSDGATYHLGWSSPEGKRLSAHNLLLWQAIRKLKAKGLHTLDLGGLNTEAIPGIARFKLGSGAQVRTLCGTWFGR